MRSVLACLPIVALISCNEPTVMKCSVEKALQSSSVRQNSQALSVDMRWSTGGDVLPLQPVAQSAASVSALPLLNAHLSTGASAQMLDASGKVLSEVPIPNLLEAKRAVGEQIRRAGNPDHIAALDRWFEGINVQAQLPTDPRAERIRMDVNGVKKEYLVSALKAQATRTGVVSQALATTSSGVPEGFVQVYGSEKRSNRLNILIMSDGYKQEEMGRFRQDVEAVRRHLLSLTPFKEYAHTFNIWRVEIPSVDSGVSCDDGTNRLKNTAFGTTFPVACINATFGSKYNDRFIIQTLPLRATGIQGQLKDENGKGVAVSTYILANSPKYGGASVFFPSQTNMAAMNADIFSHEFGHGFAGLADEYVAPGDPCNIFAWDKPNVNASATTPDKVKWNAWLDKSVPLPTPATAEFRDKVGLYQGAADCATLFYRPAQMCKMESNYGSYCKICREQMVLRLHDVFRPIESEITQAASGGKQTFDAQVQSPSGGLETHWFVDGKEVQTGSRYAPLQTSLSSGKHQIVLTVKDNSEYVRRDQCHLFEARKLDVTVQ